MFARIVLLLSFMGFAAPAVAQLHRALLHAELIDEQSQPAADVPVRLVSEATGSVRRTVSDAAGRITVAQLEPGIYRIEIEHDRYRDFVARVPVRPGEVVEVRLPLALGSVGSIDARPFFLNIDKESPALRTRFDDALLTRIPLESRLVADLVLLAPGTTAGEFGPTTAGIAVPSTGYFLDGFSNMEPLLGTPAVGPVVESLLQAEVVRGSYDAAHGRTAGAQVNLAARSGTNTFRGGGHALYQTRADHLWLGGFGGGPLAKNRTFAFGSAEHRGVDESLTFRHDGHHVDGRVDRVFDGGSWLTGRYAVTRGTALQRRGQHGGVSLTNVPSARLTNDLRLGFSRVSFGEFADLPGLAESNAWQIADTVTWWTGAHLTKVGGEWYGFSRGVDSDELAAHLWSAFVQNDWRAASAVTLTTGLRIERFSERSSTESDTSVAPRFGFAWALGAEQRTAIRGGYGRYVNQSGLGALAPRFDNWSIGAQRQMGRLRTLEATYVGSNGDEMRAQGRTMRYQALQVQMQQRSETALSGQFGYTYGHWTVDGPVADTRARWPFDSRHKATAAFSLPLPIGDERRWLHRGRVGQILRDIELAGIAVLQSGRPVNGDDNREQPSYSRLDLALLKFIRFRDATLQLRLEAFNVTNRVNPTGTLFSVEPFHSFVPTVTGRRYQLGVKAVF